METFTIEQFQNFTKMINCMNYGTFKEMYNQLGFENENYITEKFEMKNQNFLTWFCDLSQNYLAEMIHYCETI